MIDKKSISIIGIILLIRIIYDFLNENFKYIVAIIGACILGIIVFAILVLGFINIVTSITQMKRSSSKYNLWLFILGLITFLIILIGIFIVYYNISVLNGRLVDGNWIINLKI